MRGRPSHEPGTPRMSRHDWWGVVLEVPDPAALAHFYAELLGWEITKEEADWAAITPPEGVAYLAFQAADGYVPPVWPAQEGAQRITMHLDFEVAALHEAVAHARELGARESDHQPQGDVKVMLDPAGHPFCLYQDGSSGQGGEG